MSDHIYAFLCNGLLPSVPETSRRGRPSSPATSLVSGHSDSSSPERIAGRHRRSMAHDQFSPEEIQIRLYGEAAAVTARISTHDCPPMPGPTDSVGSRADANADRKER